MKCFQRYLSLFVVVVLLSLAFSITANAEEVPDYNVITIGSYFVENESIYNEKSLTFNSNDSSIPSAYYESSAIGSKAFEYTLFYRIKSIKGDYIIKKGSQADISFNNTFFAYKLIDGGSEYWTYKPSTVRALVTYDDNSMEYINASFTQHDNLLDLKCSLVPNKNVTAIEFIMSARATPYTSMDFVYYLGNHFNAKHTLIVEQSSEEAGLLKGIIEWLKGIKDGITNLFNSIAELPSKLWNLISDGLKSLFVPSEEYMSNFSDSWDELLSQRFGAIYQVGDIISDFVKRIQVSDITNTISMPSVNLNSVGIPFSFGGYDIKIVPDGFTVIVEICKKIISIACTFLFINGLRKRYDEVMGVEK